MKTAIKFKGFSLLVLLSFLMLSCNNDDDDSPLPPVKPNIVELAQSVPDLGLLVDALIQADAGLVEVLSGDGPFTVFAPTNAAFTDLLDQLGADYNSLADFDTADEKALLAKILTY
ncbi:fasciclin domain-containing protein, partial [Flavobacteriaceae bacterium F89]